MALGFTGLHLQTESVARFGQLLLQDGRWNGQRILPEGWVALATRKHIDNDDDPDGPVDWRQGYGYQYWLARHGFRGDGAHGQFCVVVPEADLVVATTARVDDMQQVLDVLWDQLLPALDADAGGVDRYASEARLTERLESLTLPVVVPTHEGPDGTVRFVVEERPRTSRSAWGRSSRSPATAPTIYSASPSTSRSWPSPAGYTAGRRVGSAPAGSRAASDGRRRPSRRRWYVVAAGPAGTPSRPTSCSSRLPIGSACGATVPASRRRGTGHPCPVRHSRRTCRADLGWSEPVVRLVLRRGVLGRGRPDARHGPHPRCGVAARPPAWMSAPPRLRFRRIMYRS